MEIMTKNSMRERTKLYVREEKKCTHQDEKLNATEGKLLSTISQCSHSKEMINLTVYLVAESKTNVVIYSFSGLYCAHFIELMPLLLMDRSARRPQSPNVCLSFSGETLKDQKCEVTCSRSYDYMSSRARIKTQSDNTKNAFFYSFLNTNNSLI